MAIELKVGFITPENVPWLVEQEIEAQKFYEHKYLSCNKHIGLIYRARNAKYAVRLLFSEYGISNARVTSEPFTLPCKQ